MNCYTPALLLLFYFLPDWPVTHPAIGHINLWCCLMEGTGAEMRNADLGVVPVMGLRVALKETKPVMMEKTVQTVMNRHQ